MTNFRTALARGVTPLLLLLLLAATAGAANIVIINNNAPGVGFNDPAPRAPVGGNPGITLGQQRLLIFQAAATQWGKIITSPIQIQVRAQFANQTCGPSGAVLGSAGSINIFANFAGAPFANTWYGGALANSIAGADLSVNPDINATFNMAIDTGCFNGLVWYYGLDGNEGVNIELLPVVLHEIGHGLGFQTFTNGSTGAFNGGLPSIWDRFLFDPVTGLTWHVMTNAQRQASAISGSLVWIGPTVSAAVPNFLSKRPRMLVIQPGGIAGSYDAGGSTLGPPLTALGHQDNVILADDGAGLNINDGCEPYVNAGAVSGNIALVDRGNCTFVIKAQQAQAAGATGLIIANNAGGPLSPGGVDNTITIPVMGITQAQGTMLKTELAVPNKVEVNMGLHPTFLAGADNSNRILMYAPNPFQGGSSVSHYDVTATPNILMEPAINNDLHDDVDLTWPLYQDIGWRPDVTPVLLAAFSAESRARGILVRWHFSDMSDAASITLERATAERGPWGPIQTELSNEGEFTLALDTGAEAGKTYFYRLSVMDRQGRISYHGHTSARREVVGDAVALSAPWPNPASGDVALTLRLSQPEFVRLAVVDAAGRKVASLQDGMMAPGEHPLTWNLRTDGGADVAPGLYFVTMTTSKGMTSQRVAVTR